MERNVYLVLIVPLFIQQYKIQVLDTRAPVFKMLHKHIRLVVLALMDLDKLMPPPNA